MKIRILIPFLGLQNIVLALTKCPEKPDTLLGYQEPIEQLDTAYTFIQEQAKLLKDGGCYSPPDCEPLSRVLVVVPYRDRAEHLNILLRNIHPFLQRQKIEYCVVVSEQVNTGKFNKGVLMNAAFQESKLFFDFDCVVFHDVDMLPENDLNSYLCKSLPTHLSTKINKYEYRYPYGTDFGGVTMIKRSQYELVNGHSNLFWGWGKEDSDIEWRLKNANLSIVLPDDIDYGRYTMLNHKHTDTFQNEAVTRNIEDDRTTTIKKTLMGIRSERVVHDGLTSLHYNLAGIEPKLLYTNMLFDLEIVRWKTVSVRVNNGEILEIYPQSKLKECRYIPFENTVADAQLRMKGVKALYHMNKTHCAGGCGGFQSQYSQMSRKKIYFPVTAPLMQKEYPPVRSTVHVKTCSNDLSTWQVLQPVTQTGQNGEISVVLDFSGRRKTEDTGRLFYRDSWVFEGKRAITHNIEISKFSQIRSSEYTTIYQENDVTDEIQITVGLSSSGIASGYYAVYSKIVDSYGQPYAELNWLFEVKNEDRNSVKEMAARKEMVRRVGQEADTNFTSLIPELKREMKMDFLDFFGGKEKEETFGGGQRSLSKFEAL